jgi:hypothetical protein
MPPLCCSGVSEDSISFEDLLDYSKKGEQAPHTITH